MLTNCLQIMFRTQNHLYKRDRSKEKITEICNSCKDESDRSKSSLSNKRLFLKLILLLEWLKASSFTVLQQSIQIKIKVLQKENSYYQKMKSELNSVMIELWLNLNFSLRKLIAQIIKDNKYELLTQQISKLLSSFFINPIYRFWIQR